MRRRRGRVKGISTTPPHTEMEEETAVLTYSGATTSTRTRACQKTPSPITQPVVRVRKLLPVIKQGAGLAQNGGSESQNDKKVESFPATT